MLLHSGASGTLGSDGADPSRGAVVDFIPVERQLPVGPISSLDMLRLVCDGSIQGFAVFAPQKSCSVEIASGRVR